MGILDRVLANKALAVAHRLAPVVSASILSIYFFSGKKAALVLGNEITIGQNHAIEAKRSYPNRSWSIGGG